jgi:glutamine amidotransferase
MTRVTIADFGSGNLLSVRRAFAHLGAEIVVTTSPVEIAAADKLVVPGVGAFADSMRGLIERGLADPVRAFAATGKPVLGICVGMQMLFDRSEEFGSHAGLGLIPGDVRCVPAAGSDGKPHKVPHVGWSPLMPRADWSGTPLDGVAAESFVYFVHSFTAHPANDSDRLADSDYDGCRIAAMVRRGNIYGCQFHPEKSGAVGLAILDRFLALPT